MMTFEELHRKSIEELKVYYKNQYPVFNEEEIRKKFITIIKSKNFINDIINPDYDFQDSEYNSFL
jgi:hypothetical protein